MAAISITKTHDLSHEKAKELAERLVSDLAKRHAFAWRWEGDDVHFKRPGISGVMRVGRTAISLDMEIGLLLSPLRPAIEKEIHAQLDRLTGSSASA
jgi:putative polyhydroxyalkanoate system protein